MYGAFDGFYADAVFAVVAVGHESSRRMGRAIDWLDLAWRNTPSITQELRVVLLRTGFEALFGTDDTFDARDNLSALLDRQDADRSRRQWTTRSGKAQTEDLSELSWWFMQFAFLRNEIMHGKEVDPAMFEHDGRPHVWLAESRLRQAIKALVARSGYPTVLLDPRARARKLRLERFSTESDPSEGGSTST